MEILVSIKINFRVFANVRNGGLSLNEVSTDPSGVGASQRCTGTSTCYVAAVVPRALRVLQRKVIPQGCVPGLVGMQNPAANLERSTLLHRHGYAAAGDRKTLWARFSRTKSRAVILNARQRCRLGEGQDARSRFDPFMQNAG